MSIVRKRLTLGTKIALGFAALTTIAVVLGGVGYYGANRNAVSLSEIGGTHFPALEATSSMREAAMSTKSVLRTLLQRDLESSMRQRQYDLATQARRDFDAAAAIYTPLPKSAEESAIWQELTSVWADWQKANDEFFRLARELDALKVGDPIALERDLALFRGQHFELETKVFRSCETGATFEGGTDHTACAFGKWLLAHPNHENPEIAAGLSAIAPRHQRFHAAAKQAKEMIAAGNRDSAMKLIVEEMEPDARETFEVFGRMQRTAAIASALNEKLTAQALQVCRVPQLKASELLDRLVVANREAANTETQQGRRLAAALQSVNFAVVLGGILLAVALAFFIVRSTSRSIRTVAETLGDASTQVSSAAAQVSATSQTLAEGASEQAASLEETSAAIEEINGQAKQNADHGSHATELMTQKAAPNFQILQDRASRVQQAITSAVHSANKTSSIIKTIDEIAFQTNILALNAAVEAARAGEAGAGFAVVADEVRNLAQRAAAAAKETTATIDESNQRINDAQKLNEELSAALTTNLEISQEITKLVTEVANASREQATGLAQTSTALQQMDRVTQSNAANAEQTAAAAEELNTQSAVLLENVRELLAVVGADQHAGAPAATRERATAPHAPTAGGTVRRTTATTATVADPHFADL